MDEQDATTATPPTAGTSVPPSRPSPLGDHRKEILEHRGWLRQLDYQSSAEYDKLLTTLAGGGLSVSMGVFRDEVGTSWEGGLLLACWALFAATLVLALLAFLPTRAMLRAEINRLDTMLSGTDQSEPAAAVRHAQARARRLNRVALWLFIAGIVCQLTFLATRSIWMSDKARNAPITIRESYDRVVPPPPPPAAAPDPSRGRASYDQIPPPPPPPPAKE